MKWTATKRKETHSRLPTECIYRKGFLRKRFILRLNAIFVSVFSAADIAL